LSYFNFSNIQVGHATVFIVADVFTANNEACGL